MKQPSGITYLLGNPLVFFGVGAITAITTWQALMGNASGLLLIPLAMLGLACKRSYDRLEAYRAWKLEWEAMEGHQRPAIRPQTWRYVLGGGAWLAVALASLSLAGDPGTAWMVLLFWAGSAGLLIRKLILWGKRRAAAAAAQSSPVVAVCPAVPLRSPPVAQTYNVLPEYCGKLF